MWPFHKTVDTISKWLIKKADGVTLNCENVIPNANVVPLTPQRVGRDNPRNSFAEDRSWTTVCGATPGRGTAKFPKNRTSSWEKDQDRLHNCAGNLFQVKGKKRNRCYLCGSKSSFMCIGCKRFYCVVNRYDKVHQSILDSNTVVNFLDGICPPASFNIKEVAEDGSTSDFVSVENSCYHICHKAAVSKGVASAFSRSPLSSVGEQRSNTSLSPL